MKKSFLFTVDAIIGSILLVSVLIMLSYNYNTNSSLDNGLQMGYELINSFANMKVNNVNNAYVKSLVADGTITDQNESVLDAIGELWAANETDIAGNVIANLTQDMGMNGYNYGFYIDNQSIFIKNKTTLSKSSSLIIASRMVSGIDYNKTRLGYIARAYATKITKNTTFTLMGDVISSSVRKPWGGTNHNKVSVTYYFDLPNQIHTNSAELYYEAPWTGDNFKAYYDGSFIPGSSGVGSKLVDMNGYDFEGTHNLTLVSWYRSNSYEGGDDGASHLVVKYSTNLSSTIQSMNNFSFAQVVSDCSIKYKKPVFPVGSLKSMDVHLNVTAKKVYFSIIVDGVNYPLKTINIAYDKSGVALDFNDSYLRSLLLSHGIDYDSLSNKYFWFQINLGTYSSAEIKSYEREIHKGSYASINTNINPLEYGKIDVTTLLDCSSKSNFMSDGFYSHLEWGYDSSSAIAPLKIDSQLSWLYYSGHDPSQLAMSNSQILYQHPPQPLVIEFSRFGFTNDNVNFINGLNKYVLNFGSSYGVDPDHSIVAFTFLVNNQVPYGNTFPTEKAALDDAVLRLKKVLGSYVNALDISEQSVKLSGVPTLWGPITIEIRIWK